MRSLLWDFGCNEFEFCSIVRNPDEDNKEICEY